MKTFFFFSFFILTIFLIGCSNSNVEEEAINENQAEEKTVKEFNIKAFRFGYEPDEIRVKLGDTVKINIDNSDTVHGIVLTEFGVFADEEVEFVADQAGTFRWGCNKFCGAGHSTMGGTLIVEE